MADIFISYASEDREKVAPLGIELQERGWTVFWDRTIPIGKTWDEVIEEELNDAKCVIVIWSNKSIFSRWVRAEAEEGLKRNILLPVAIENVKLPLLFRPVQTLELTDWQVGYKHPNFEKLLSDLLAIVEPSNLQKKKEIQLEIEQNNIDISHKSNSVTKHKVCSTKHKADNERYHKERKELESGTVKFENRSAIEGVELKTETNKEIKNGIKKLQRIIVHKPLSQYMLCISMTSSGWAIALLMGLTIDKILSGTFGITFSRTIGSFFMGVIGGLILIIAMQLTVLRFQLKQTILIIFGWALAGSIGSLIMAWGFSKWAISGAMIWAICMAIEGFIGGLITAITLRRPLPNILVKHIILVAFGWAFSWAISCLMTLKVCEAFLDSIEMIIGRRTIGCSIMGVVGGLITIIIFQQIKRNVFLNEKLYIICGGAISGAIVGFICEWSYESGLLSFGPWLFDISGSMLWVFCISMTGAIGGLITVITLRREIQDIQLKHGLLIISGWASGAFIGWVIGHASAWRINWEFLLVINGFTIGAIGSLVTLITLKQVIKTAGSGLHS